MRAIVLNHDRQHNSIQEFDLNNPPKAPYRFVEFPKAMYHHETAGHRVVQNAQEEAHWAEKGWNTSPVPVEVSMDIAMSAGDIAEAQAIDAQLVHEGEYKSKLRNRGLK